MKIRAVFFLLGACMATSVWSQDSTAIAGNKVDSTIYSLVEEYPVFVDGDAGLIKFLMNNTRYPQAEKDSMIMGRVILKFVVELDGTVSNIAVNRSVSPGLDAEAVRLAKLLQFKPGRMWGKPVRVYMYMPFVFRLQ